jgi:acyl dehydratase
MNDGREPLTSFRVAAVNAERMKALALLVEDPNPIHIFPEDAAAAGLGDRVINPGSANLGYVLNALLAIDPNVEIENVQIALRGNVAAGDEVVAAVRCSGGDETDDGRLRLRCEVALDVTDGSRAMEGTAVVTIPDRVKLAKASP